jgi:hypothetical protein
MTREIGFSFSEQGGGDIDSRELCGEEKDFYGNIYTESFTSYSRNYSRPITKEKTR